MQNTFSPDYLNGLVNGPGNFDPMLVDQLQAVKNAPIPERPNSTISYSRLARQDATGNPILYVPGFTEGIVAKAPFGLAMAEHGHDIIIPDQNRDAKPERKDATEEQATNYLAIIEAEGLQHSSVNIVAHSYGALIFAKMAQLAKQRGWSCFDEARVALVAPSGQYEDENLVKLGARFARMLISEVGSDKAFPDETGLQMKAGQGIIKSNPVRAAQEVRSLNREMVSYEGLSQLVGKIGIFGYRDDKLYGHKQLQDGAQKAMEFGGSYAVPINYELDENGEAVRINSAPATHNDEQFNPSRVAGAVSQFFDPNTR